MARARNIKPGFFANEDLVELPFSTRLLFIGLWTIADRAGRLEDRPKRIKMAIFPADDVNVDCALDELQASGFLLRYEHGGERYIQILAFDRHQNPHRDEKQSTIPAPCEHGANTENGVGKNSANLADSPIPDSPNEDSGIPEPKPAAQSAEYSDDFETAWQEYPARSGASKKDAFRAWNARLKDGVDAEDMISGVKRYASYCFAMETEPQFIKLPATFFGPGEHYAADWKPVKPARASPARPQLDLAAAQKAANEEAKRRLFGGDDGRTIDA